MPAMVAKARAAVARAAKKEKEIEKKALKATKKLVHDVHGLTCIHARSGEGHEAPSTEQAEAPRSKCPRRPRNLGHVTVVYRVCRGVGVCVFLSGARAEAREAAGAVRAKVDRSIKDALAKMKNSKALLLHCPDA